MLFLQQKSRLSKVNKLKKNIIGRLNSISSISTIKEECSSENDEAFAIKADIFPEDIVDATFMEVLHRSGSSLPSMTETAPKDDHSVGSLSTMSYDQSASVHLSLPLSMGGFDVDDEDISVGSIESDVLAQIRDLQCRLRMQEETKSELLKQCLRLQKRVTSGASFAVDTGISVRHLKQLKKENLKLKEEHAEREKEYMNTMNELEGRIKGMEKLMKERDDKILELEKNIAMMKVSKKGKSGLAKTKVKVKKGVE